MKKVSEYKLLLVGIVLITFSLTLVGCAMNYAAPIGPPQGLFITTIKAPLTTDFKGTDIGGATIKASKKEIYYFRDIIFTGLDFSWGTADIPEIARQAGIKEVTCAEYELLNILGVYAQFTVHVYGN